LKTPLPKTNSVKLFHNKRKNGFLHELKKNKALYLMLMPGTVLLITFSYLPMPGVLLAFKNLKFHGNIFESFMKSDWVWFNNFKLLFAGPNALLATRNTVLYNAAFIVIGLISSVSLAIALNEIRNKFLAKIYQTVFIMPHFLSWVIVAYFVYGLFSIENGIINRSILEPMGIEPISWYYEPQYWPYILILSNIWKTVGFNAIVYLATISGIDPEYYEAALIDGASKWKQIKYITIPLMMPIIVILTILAIGKIFYADFGLFFNVPRGSNMLLPATEVIDTYVYRIMRTGDFGLASASGLYQSIVGFILIMISNKIVKKIEPEYSLF
jgi:putative aldouronate transport system permease protein